MGRFILSNGRSRNWRFSALPDPRNLFLLLIRIGVSRDLHVSVITESREGEITDDRDE